MASRKRIFSPLFPMAGALITLGVTAAAAEPTFKETRDWIVDKINKNNPHRRGYGTGSINYDITELKLNNCTLQYNEFLHQKHDSYVWYKTNKKYSIELSDVKSAEYDPPIGSHSHPKISITAYSETINENITSSHYSHEENWTSSYSSRGAEFTIQFESEENLGERMAKAITHLGKLAYENPDCPKHTRPREVKDVF